MTQAIATIEDAGRAIGGTAPYTEVTLEPNQHMQVLEGNVQVNGGVPKGAMIDVVKGHLRIAGNIAQNGIANSWYGDVEVQGNLHPKSTVNSLKGQVRVDGNVEAARVMAAQEVVIRGDVLSSRIGNDAEEASKQRPYLIAIMGHVTNSTVTSHGDVVIGGSLTQASMVKTSAGAIRIDGDVADSAAMSTFNRVRVGGNAKAGAALAAAHGMVDVGGTIEEGACVGSNHGHVAAASISEHARVDAPKVVSHSPHPRIAGAGDTKGQAR